MTECPCRAVLAIDPGKTTGMVLVACSGREIHFVGAWELGIHKAIDLAEKIITEYNMAVEVVCEDFRLFPWKAKAQSFSYIPAAEVIGALKYVCSKHGVEIKFQSPQVKNLVSEMCIKRNGLWVKGKPHARDAMRHAVYRWLVHSKEVNHGVEEGRSEV